MYMYIVFRFHGHHMACMFLCQEVTKRYEHKKKKHTKNDYTVASAGNDPELFSLIYVRG